MDVWYDARRDKLFLVGSREYDFHDVIIVGPALFYIGAL